MIKPTTAKNNYVMSVPNRSQSEHFSASSSQLSAMQTESTQGFQRMEARMATVEAAATTTSEEEEKRQEHDDPTAKFTARGALTTLQSIDDKVCESF